jgi:hypothetical protein
MIWSPRRNGFSALALSPHCGTASHTLYIQMFFDVLAIARSRKCVTQIRTAGFTAGRMSDLRRYGAHHKGRDEHILLICLMVCWSLTWVKSKLPGEANKIIYFPKCGHPIVNGDLVLILNKIKSYSYFWDQETCREVGQKCSKRTDFTWGSGCLYSFANNSNTWRSHLRDLEDYSP